MNTANPINAFFEKAVEAATEIVTPFLVKVLATIVAGYLEPSAVDDFGLLRLFGEQFSDRVVGSATPLFEKEDKYVASLVNPTAPAVVVATVRKGVVAEQATATLNLLRADKDNKIVGLQIRWARP